MKKLFSIFLALIIAITSVQFVFASETQCSSIQLIEEKNDGSKVYGFTFQGVENTIEVKEINNGTMYVCRDGNKTNQLLFLDSGKILLDGEEVKITTTCIDEGSTDVSTPTPRAYYEIVETSKSPFAPGPYTTGGATYVSNIETEQKIKTFSLGVLISLVGGAFFPDANTYTSTGFSGALEAFLTQIIEEQYEGKSFYYRRRVWSNGNPDLSGSPLKYYYWYEVTYCDNHSFIGIKQDDSFYSMTKITNH